MGHADARPKQPHIVVDLGNGADRGARVLRGGLLLDGDGRRQTVDLVDVRLLHHLQELACIGRQRFDVAALALGIDRIEGERGFARAGQAREHDQLIARQFHVDVLEIVLARAADGDDAAVMGALGSAAFGIAAGVSALVEQIVHCGLLKPTNAVTPGRRRMAAYLRVRAQNVVRTEPKRQPPDGMPGLWGQMSRQTQGFGADPLSIGRPITGV